MLDVNVGKLLDAIYEAGSIEYGGVEQGRMYLLEHFITPLMRDGSVELLKLDFDAFDQDDIYPIEVGFGGGQYGEEGLRKEVQETYKACRFKQKVIHVKSISSAVKFV